MNIFALRYSRTANNLDRVTSLIFIIVILAAFDHFRTAVFSFDSIEMKM